MVLGGLKSRRGKAKSELNGEINYSNAMRRTHNKKCTKFNGRREQQVPSSVGYSYKVEFALE